MTFVIQNRQWAYLAIAILLEVTGTITMKIAAMEIGFVSADVAMIAMYVLIGFSYYFLALSVTRLPVGVAYAFWEGVGLTLITVISVVFLGETMNLTRFIALMAIVSGAVLIHHGTGSGKTATARKAPSSLGIVEPVPDAPMYREAI